MTDKGKRPLTYPETHRKPGRPVPSDLASEANALCVAKRTLRPTNFAPTPGTSTIITD